MEGLVQLDRETVKKIFESCPTFYNAEKSRELFKEAQAVFTFDELNQEGVTILNIYFIFEEEQLEILKYAHTSRTWPVGTSGSGARIDSYIDEISSDVCYDGNELVNMLILRHDMSMV